jgi:mono/diheme cytochrome c family protein
VATLRAFAIAGLLGMLAAPSADAASLNRQQQRGQALLTTLCSSCHAVGPGGDSPHRLAPPFRTIESRYDIDDLVEKLREGFTAPHPDMPTFNFSRQDAQAVKAYLKAIQK